MPLEAGSVFVRIAGLFDKTQFDEADKRVDAMRAEAKKSIDYHIGIDDKTVQPKSMAAHKAVQVATEKPVEIPIGVNGTRAVAEAAAVHKAVSAELSKPVDIRSSGGGSSGGRLSIGELLGGLLHKPGGPMGLGGMSLGSMIGLGPEHLITAGASFLGTLGPALGGAGLALMGSAGKEVVGGGADALIQHTTRANAEAIYKLQLQQQQAIQNLANQRNLVIRRYGSNSRQATAARQQYSRGVAAQNLSYRQAVQQQAGSGVGVTAETQLAGNVKTLSTNYKKESQQAQAESAGFYEQIVNFAEKILPFVIQSAARNLKILDKDIRPLFSWLGGPQGMGIFKSLENDFAKGLPTSIHMFTQAIELVLKIMKDAAAVGGGFSKTLDRFFTKENHRSAESLDKTVKRLIGDMHDWTKLLSAFGKVFSGIMHDSAHEGIGLVKQLTNVLDKMAKWERSAAGSKELHSFFVGRANELQAILKTLGPLLKVFFQFYMSVQVLVPGVTKLFEILGKILTPIAKLAQHNNTFRDAFVVPLGAFLLLWNRFGWTKAIGTVKSLGSAFMFLGRHITGASRSQKQLGSGESGGGSLLSRIKNRLTGGAAGAVEDAVSGSIHIAGATGEGIPGSRTNPIVVTLIDPKFSGMGEQAQGYAKEEEGGAESDVGEGYMRRADGLIVPAEEGSAATGAAALAEDAAGSGGILSKLKGLLSFGGEGGGLLSKLGGIGSLAGGIGAIGGTIAAPIIGSAIGGRAGRAVSTIGGSAATGAGLGMMFGPEGAAVGGLVGAGYGIVKNAGGVGKMLGTDASFYGGIAKKIGSAFSSAWKGVEHDASAAWDWITHGVGKLIDGIVGFFKKLPGQVWGFIKGIGDFFAKLGDDIGKEVSKIVDAVAGFFEKLPGRIWNFVKGIPAFFENIGKDILTWAGHLISNVAGFFEKLPSDIWNFVKGIPGDFLNLGKSIITSIVHGIENAPGAVLHALEGVIPKPLRGFLSSAGNAVSSAASSVGHFFGLARGGMVPGREHGLTDQMTLVDPSGRPRARMAGDESMYTRHQRPYVDAGLQMLGFREGSDELWRKVTTPHSYSDGGSLPFAGGLIRHFASGGNLGPASNRTINATLSKYGTGALNAIDNRVSNLDNKYTMQQNIFSMYDNPSGGNLPVKDLNVLMGIREQQWDLLYNEWLKLPNALKTLQTIAYGHGSGDHRTGGIRTTVNDLNKDITALSNLETLISSDTKPSGTLTLQHLKQYYPGQSVTSITSYQRQNQQITLANAQRRRSQAVAQGRFNATATNQVDAAINSMPNAPSNGTMYSVYKSSAQQMANVTDQLKSVHQRSLQLTKQINGLLAQRHGASASNKNNINNQIASLRASRSDNNDQAVKLTSQLTDIRLANEGIGVEYQDQNYYARLAKAAAETGLTGKTTELQLVLRELRTELANEQKLEQRTVSAIDTIKGKIDQSGSGNSLVDELSNYGYDIMGLNQQGAKVPTKYQDEIDRVFKALGIKLPPHWADTAAMTQASQSWTAFQNFQQTLSSTFGSYGSNFVAAGANPYGSKAAKMAGNAFYGAAGGTHSGGAPAASASQPGPVTTDHTVASGQIAHMQSGGDTNINITQHFGGPAPDPHTYSHGLKYELGAAI